MRLVRATACAFAGTVAHPRRTFESLDGDPRAGWIGAAVLLAVSAVYTLILLAFLAVGYPAAARSALGVPVDDQYRLQVWYQAPLFFATTAVAAGILAALGRLGGRRGAFGTAFGRVGLATAVPFALTTMLVESTAALLLVAGVLDAAGLLSWLTGDGAWFAAAYQIVGVVWLAGLVFVAAAVSLRRSRWVHGAATGIVVCAYALPIALLIR
jgi:hypothetical protein